MKQPKTAKGPVKRRTATKKHFQRERQVHYEDAEPPSQSQGFRMEMTPPNTSSPTSNIIQDEEQWSFASGAFVVIG